MARPPLTFKDYALSITPEYLEEKIGVVLGIASAIDILREKLRRAQRNIYLHTAEPVSFDSHGINSNIPRVRWESDDSLIAALRRRWDAWEQSGSEREMLIQIARLSHKQAIVVTYPKLWDVGRRGTWNGNDPDPLKRYTSFWFLVLPWPVARLNLQPVKWGGGRKWGETPNGPVWGGVGLSPLDIEAIRQVIFKWKPGHTSCRFILVALGPGFVLHPDFTWSGPAITYPVNEWWEFDAKGYARPFYNQTPDRQ